MDTAFINTDSSNAQSIHERTLLVLFHLCGAIANARNVVWNQVC